MHCRLQVTSEATQSRAIVLAGKWDTSYVVLGTSFTSPQTLTHLAILLLMTEQWVKVHYNDPSATTFPSVFSVFFKKILWRPIATVMTACWPSQDLMWPTLPRGLFWSNTLTSFLILELPPRCPFITPHQWPVTSVCSLPLHIAGISLPVPYMLALTPRD